jgi:hypothetical protein
MLKIKGVHEFIGGIDMGFHKPDNKNVGKSLI